MVVSSPKQELCGIPMKGNKEFRCILLKNHKTSKIKDLKKHDYGYTGKGHPGPKDEKIDVSAALKNSPTMKKTAYNDHVLGLAKMVSEQATSIANLEKELDTSMDIMKEAKSEYKALEKEKEKMKKVLDEFEQKLVENTTKLIVATEEKNRMAAELLKLKNE